jgi:hypothetical protein
VELEDLKINRESDQLCFLAQKGKPRGDSESIHWLNALTELLKLQKSGQFPDDPVRIKV